MKNLLSFSSKFYTVLLLAIFTFNSANAFKLKVKGSGGVETDGNNHKICPTKTKDVCAIIEITWRDNMERYF